MYENFWQSLWAQKRDTRWPFGKALPLYHFFLFFNHESQLLEYTPKFYNGLFYILHGACSTLDIRILKEMNHTLYLSDWLQIYAKHYMSRYAAPRVTWLTRVISKCTNPGRLVCYVVLHYEYAWRSLPLTLYVIRGLTTRKSILRILVLCIKVCFKLLRLLLVLFTDLKWSFHNPSMDIYNLIDIR